MGLPASGKTTFLAALWHLIEANETECRLILDGYRGDLSYLNIIAEAWRTFKPVPRTSQVSDSNIAIHLRNSKTNETGVAFFPDLAGEAFDRQVEERRCRPEFVEEVANDNGILFFITADVVEDALSITELNKRIPKESTTDIANIDVGIAEGQYDPASADVHEWEPKLMPIQVKIVQLLSDLIRAPFTPRNRRLAILVSAWDLTRSMKLAPQEWLTCNMPLVEQFLRANGDYFTYQVYGVSAQGVSLDDDTAVDEAAKLIPSRRIQIIGPGEEGHDLTEPLVWLMSENK
jgi:hypothetical protein